MSKTARQFFNGYLKVAPLSHALWRAVEAVALSKQKLRGPVLDIGCGFGEFGGVFFDSAVEVGLDINYSEILKAAQTGKYKKTVVADARELPYAKNSFATIISISTLEHIPDNQMVFNEAYRVLKPGGKFLFCVPTAEYYNGLVWVKVFNALGLSSLSHWYFRFLNKAFKHVCIISEDDWLKRAKGAGFKIEEVYGTLPRATLAAWELFLPFAIPSQLSKIFLGRRLTMLSGAKIKLFKPFIKLVKLDEDYRANIFVVASK